MIKFHGQTTVCEPGSQRQCTVLGPCGEMNDEEDASGNSSITKKNEEAKSCLIQKITPNDIKGQIKSLITSTIAEAVAKMEK